MEGAPAAVHHQGRLEWERLCAAAWRTSSVDFCVTVRVSTWASSDLKTLLGLSVSYLPQESGSGVF